MKKAALAAALALALPPALSAQVPADTAPRIVRIVLDRRNVFDASDSALLVPRLANALHVTTRAAIDPPRVPLCRRRPLRLGAGGRDGAQPPRARGVQRRSRSITPLTDSGMVVTVMTRDGWTHASRFPVPLDRRLDRLHRGADRGQPARHGHPGAGALPEGSRPDHHAFLLSTATACSRAGSAARWNSPTSRTANSLSATSPGRIARSNPGSAPRSTSTPSAGGSCFFATASIRPTTRWSAATCWDAIDIGTALRASSTGYLRTGGILQVRRDDYAPEAVAIDSGIAGHTVTGAFGGYVEARHAHFITVRGYQSFGRLEDVDLSSVVRISVLAAPTRAGLCPRRHRPRDRAACRRRVPGRIRHRGRSPPAGCTPRRGSIPARCHSARRRCCCHRCGIS